MERLKRLSNEAMRRVPGEFVRSLMNEIDRGQQMFGITGARGSGKTILMLQMAKKVKERSSSIYVSLDDIYFSENKLIYFAEEFHAMGGENLFLDEVHKYPGWSQELKNIYDNLPELKVVFTASSALDIYKGAYDLSRRAVVYNLPGLSFREFLTFKYKIMFPPLSLEEILFSKEALYASILDRIKPLPLFREYLEFGYYPFFKVAGKNYHRLLLNTVNQVIENDLPAIYNIDYHAMLKIKKLLVILSRIVPFKPNIEKLASQTGVTRDTLLKYLYYLDKAQIIKRIDRDTHGINLLNKPEKIYLNNTNLFYALNDLIHDTGALRETFFLNQLSTKHTVTYPEKGDFLVDGKYLFETGGKNKTQKQIGGIKNSYIVADNTEYRFENKIPIWLFGFLY